MKEALYYNQLGDNSVKCRLCPHECVISPLKSGICLARGNIEGKLYSANYGVVSALNLDPIEKKPLYHYYPGKKILSIGSFGCNLKCRFCQNWEISQTGVDSNLDGINYSPDKIVEMAKKMSLYDNIGIAYTYNEPLIWYEFVKETAQRVKEAGLKNVLVSNGYINTEPLLELIEYIDAFNIDLKGFTEKFYKEVTHSDLEVVKKNLKIIKESKKHLEITHLVVTDENDNEEDFEKMVNWINEELGIDTVLHISRYFPRYQMTNTETKIETLEKFYAIAKKKLKFVYIGNASIQGTENTYCPKCGKEAIIRKGYNIQIVGLKEDKCIFCDEKII